MPRKHPYFRDLISLTANVAVFHTIYMLIRRISEDPVDLFGFLQWCGILCAVYLILALLFSLRRFAQYAFLVITAALTLQIYLVCRFGNPPGRLISWLYTILLWGIPYIRAAEFFTRPTPAEQRMLDFESSALMMVITVILCSSGTYPLRLVVPTALASLFTLFSLASGRTAGSRNRGNMVLASRACLVVISVAAIGAALLFLRYAASFASQWLNILARHILALLRSLGNLFVRMLVWFFSLFPTARREIVLPAETMSAMDGNVATAVSDGSFLLLPLLILLLLAGALMLFFLLRDSFHFPTADNTNGKRARLTAPRFSLHRLLHLLRFILAYARHRNTPSGLLVWLERKAKVHRQARRPGETCRQFITRIIPNLPGCEQELSWLADYLDRQYFAAEPPSLSAAHARKIRRKLQHTAAQTKW